MNALFRELRRLSKQKHDKEDDKIRIFLTDDDLMPIKGQHHGLPMSMVPDRHYRFLWKIFKQSKSLRHKYPEVHEYIEKKRRPF